jgi:hypothetical protein
MRQATFIAQSAQNTEQFIDVRGPIDRLASLSEFHVLPQRHDRAGVGLAGAILQPSFLLRRITTCRRPPQPFVSSYNCFCPTVSRDVSSPKPTRVVAQLSSCEARCCRFNRLFINAAKSIVFH